MKFKIFTYLLFLSVISFSQNINNNFKKTFLFSDTIVVDTNLVLPSSIFVFSNNQLVSNNFWHFDFQTNSIIFNNFIADEITVKYQTIPYNFSAYSLKDTSLIVPKTNNYNSKISNKNTNYVQPLNSNQLQTDGSMSRSVGVGNNQDAVITSTMNLNISGKLNDNLNIEATAFDETMPIQPDGNTAQIQELNNVNIKVFNDNFQLTAGDFYPTKPQSYFLKYNKQLKGLQYSTSNKSLNNNIVVNSANVGAGVAKGKYKRQQIAGVEANQGPYRLTGNNGETYIVVLAESERVYIDGKLLTRGNENDYTINYNTAEIIFTAKNPVTKDTRVIVEFEYSERNYTRFTLFSNNSFSIGESSFYANMFSETDAKNQTIDRELTDDMKEIMYYAGDSLNQALLPNVDTVEFSEDKILYRKIDTVINNEVITFYENSTNSQQAIFQVNFAYVGANNGNYVISEQLTNGRVYKYVLPVGGFKQGDYEPNSVLVTPKKHSVYDFGGFIPINNKNILNFDVSISQNDKNLFSPINDDDNSGLAFRLNYSHFFYGDDTTSEKSGLFTNYEYASFLFAPVETYKTQEFVRDWNLFQNFTSDEHLFRTGYFVSKTDKQIETSVASLFHSKEYFSVKPELNFSRIGETSNVLLTSNYLYSNNLFNLTNFGRSNFIFKQKIGKIFLGTNYEQETNIWKKPETDTILKNSFMFHSAGFFIETSDTNNFIFRSEYSRRWDFLPDDKDLKQVSLSNDFNVSARMNNQNSNGTLLLNYRQLYVQDTNLLKVEPENSLNGKLLFNVKLFNEAISSFSSFDLNSGLEQKLQFIFIEVEPSKGVYTWIDYNEDGIKQIDEFEIAQFSDQANFVRLPMQSNEYVKIYGKSFNQSLAFSPANLFSNTSKMYDLASKFNNSTNFEIVHKSHDFSFSDFTDTNAVNYSFVFNNMFIFNVLPGVNLKMIYQKYNTKIEMISGIDNLSKTSKKIAADFRLLKFVVVSDEVGKVSNLVFSDYSSQKNYNINSNENQLMLKFIKDELEFNLVHTYSDKRNIQGNEVLIINDFTGNFNYSISAKQAISMSFSYIDNNFKGDASSSVAYSMLNGLKPDKNYTWQLNLSNKIGKIIIATILYSGRYSTGNKIIHTGNIRLMAVL